MHAHRPIVIVPQCPENESWGNFSSEDISLQATPTQAMKLLIELINQAISTLPIDTSRIYITGLSMGGFGTFDAISRHPDLFAAAVPVCGGGDSSIASSFSNVPIWIFHGALDEAVHPYFANTMYEALRKAGANPGFTMYPETGHFSWIAAYSDLNMMDWLFRQKK